MQNLPGITANVCRRLLFCISFFIWKLDFDSSRHVIILTEHLYILTCIDLEESRYLGKESIERSTHRRKTNIKINLIGSAWECVEYNYLIQDMEQWRAVAKTVINLWVY
jgi:hypothetical protein